MTLLEPDAIKIDLPEISAESNQSLSLSVKNGFRPTKPIERGSLRVVLVAHRSEIDGARAAERCDRNAAALKQADHRGRPALSFHSRRKEAISFKSLDSVHARDEFVIANGVTLTVSPLRPDHQSR